MVVRPAAAAVLQPLGENNVLDLSSLHSALFPVSYSKRFYDDLLAGPPELARLVFQDGLLVAAVCCAVDADALHVLTLGVRAAYRERGLGTALLKHVLHTAEQSPVCAAVARIYMHVQEGNEEALRFYGKFGFSVRRKLLFYYARVSPPHCFEVDKVIRPHLLRSRKAADGLHSPAKHPLSSSSSSSSSSCSAHISATPNTASATASAPVSDGRSGDEQLNSPPHARG